MIMSHHERSLCDKITALQEAAAELGTTVGTISFSPPLSFMQAAHDNRRVVTWSGTVLIDGKDWGQAQLVGPLAKQHRLQGLRIRVDDFTIRDGQSVRDIEEQKIQIYGTIVRERNL